MSLSFKTNACFKKTNAKTNHKSQAKKQKNYRQTKINERKKKRLWKFSSCEKWSDKKYFKVFKIGWKCGQFQSIQFKKLFDSVPTWSITFKLPNGIKWVKFFKLIFKRPFRLSDRLQWGNQVKNSDSSGNNQGDCRLCAIFYKNIPRLQWVGRFNFSVV